MLKLLHNKMERQICFNVRDQTALYFTIDHFYLSIISAATSSSAVKRIHWPTTTTNNDAVASNKSTEIIFVFCLRLLVNNDIYIKE
ncbi:MAG: hypothetical protein K0S67_2324 [Nitrososphaeraceae archaeon]|nr:hypothetical protein [Nitrososphaeraceae archaeon]MDF2767678.1 hypothetical protein [Nitrososphaeraceae archaeon]